MTTPSPELVSKQAAPDRVGQVDSWIEPKGGESNAFPIVACVEKRGAKPRQLAQGEELHRASR